MPKVAIDERRRRRSLSQVGGATNVSCKDPRQAEILRKALTVTDAEDTVHAHLHGFHSFAARLHPHAARTLIAGFSKPGQLVLDPFCGSGTVLLEAKCLERRAFGCDLNPLAVRLAAFKTQDFSRGDGDKLAEAARALSEWANERRLQRAGPLVRYGKVDRQLFDIHVLLELDSLRAGIAGVADPRLRAGLWLVLSSILTKVSRQPGDTGSGRVNRRLRSGFTLQLFADRASELRAQISSLARQSARELPPCRVREADARSLPVRSNSVTLIVTSPPYPGVYDYSDHHAARLRWLGLDGAKLRRQELGARRRFQKLHFHQGLSLYEKQFTACLREFSRVLKPTGWLVLVISDVALGGRAVRADQVFERICAPSGFELLARASETRRYFHKPNARAFSRKPRCEHILLLRRTSPRNSNYC